MEIRTVDYHTAGEPFRIVTGGVEPLAGRDDPRQAARRARAARPRPPAARPRAARPRRHVRLLRRRAERRRAPTSASSSSTTPATRPRAGTGRSRSSRGRSTRASSRAGGREPRRGRRAVGPARHVGAGRGRSRALGALPQRAVVRLGRGRRARRAARSTSRSAAPSTPSVEERVEPGELPRLIELGREIKRELEAWQDDRPPARARAPRRLRRDLLAGGGRATRSRSGTSPSSPTARSTARRAAAARRRGSRCSTARAGCPRGEELRHLSIVGTEFTGRVVARDRGRGASRRGHRGRGQRLPHGRARVHARPGRPARRGLPAPLGRQQPDDFAVVGEAARGLLRVDELAVGEHVELRPGTRCRPSPRCRASP